MRSRLRKKNRSRISLLDRVVESRQQVFAKRGARLNRTPETTPETRPLGGTLLNDGELAPTPSKKRLFGHGMLDRLQQPVGIRPIFLLFITWLLMLVIIWGAYQEIMSLGAPNQAKKSVIQVEQRALLELLGALVIGGVGLSLVMTPALKRSTKPGSETAIATQLKLNKSLESSKD
jgi:small-conductance mechanosensitive channel